MNWDLFSTEHRDLYESPEHFGLSVVGYLQAPECYSFDMLAVWEHEGGSLYYATDSGCSCPTPFENFTSLEDATPITRDSWLDFCAAVMAHDDDPADKVDLQRKVWQKLTAAGR